MRQSRQPLPARGPPLRNHARGLRKRSTERVSIDPFASGRHARVPSSGRWGFQTSLRERICCLVLTPAARPQPAISVKKSIQPDYLVCLEDGKKLKMLKRHLKTAYNMTPEAYREKGRFTPPGQPDHGPSKAWAYPVVANGRLYIRDAKDLICVELPK